MRAWLLNSRVDPYRWFYLITGGYSVVSIGVATYLAENEPPAQPESFRVIGHTPPAPAMAAPLETARVKEASGL